MLKFSIRSSKEAFVLSARYDSDLIFLVLNHKINMLLAISLPECNFPCSIVFLCRRTLQRHCTGMMMMAISHTALCAVLDKRSFSVETPAAAGLNLNLCKLKPKCHANHQNRLFYHLSLFSLCSDVSVKTV